MLEVVEYTDPACPWAWGSEPVFLWLRRALAGQVSWRRVYGILFDEDEPPPPDRDAETRHYARWLAGVSAHTRAPYPLELQWVAATSWPSSQVAKAAESQGPAVAERVVRRLRETTFVDGTPADTLAAALAAVADVAGLDRARLAREAASPEVRAAIERDHAETRAPDPAVDAAAGPGPHPGARKQSDTLTRYALPTLHLAGPAGAEFVPGWRPGVGDYLQAALRVAPGLVVGEVGQDATQLLDELGSLTPQDIELLCANGVPSRARRVATHNGGLLRPI